MMNWAFIIGQQSHHECITKRLESNFSRQASVDVRTGRRGTKYKHPDENKVFIFLSFSFLCQFNLTKILGKAGIKMLQATRKVQFLKKRAVVMIAQV